MADYLVKSEHPNYGQLPWTIDLYIRVDVLAQSIDRNESTVQLGMFVRTPYDIGWDDFNGSYLGVDAYQGGTQQRYDFYNGAHGYGDIGLLWGFQATVKHASDGSAVNVPILWKWGVNSPWGQYQTPSGTLNITLPTIPRATVPSMSNPTLGSAVTISLPRASSALTHVVKYAFGNTAGTISNSAGESVSWTPPLTLASQIPNATSGVGTLTVDTYNGSTYVGTKSIQFTAYIPASVVPAISSVAISEATPGLAAKFGAYVQSKSSLKVKTTAAGVYGSTISKYETTILGVKYQGAEITSQVIGSSGQVTVTVTVTDSRGRWVSYMATVSVTAYAPPRINSMTAKRINTSGVADEDGTRVSVTANYAISSVGNRNDHTFTMSYKKSGDQYFMDFDSGSASWSYSGTENYTSGPNISVDYAYIIRLTISDYFGSAFLDFEVPTSFVLMDFRSTGRGMSIGKVSEKDALEIAMGTELSAELNTVNGFSWGAGLKAAILNLLYPVGSVYLSVNNASPATFLGGTWDLLPAKYIMSAGTVYSGGAEGGSASHVHTTGGHALTIGEMPSHNHVVANFSGTGNKTGFATLNGGAHGDPSYWNFDSPQGNSSITGGGQSHSHGNTGSANNDPLYVAVFAWRRTA